MESVSSSSILSAASVATLATLADENQNQLRIPPKKSIGQKLAKGKTIVKKAVTLGGKVTKRSSSKLLQTLRPLKSSKTSIAKKTLSGLWPSDGLYFKTFPEDEAYTLLHEILLQRGWKFAGKPYRGNDPAALDKVIKKKQPKRCLWLVDENEAHYLAKLPASDVPGERHKICCFLGSEAANYKTNLTLKLNGMDFYPPSFAMPKEMGRFEKEIRKTKSPLWIYKPKNDYGGQGCYVYNITTQEFKDRLKKDVDKRKNFVLQRYIENPLLIGGYKFHMRVFLYLESMDPPVGYIYHGGQVLFSTKKYSCDKKKLGKNFDKYAHLTNWSLHGLPNNHERLLADKDVVGVGCEWRWARLVRHLKKTFPKTFSEANMWEQLSHIGRECFLAILSHPTLKKYSKKMVKNRHFEVFGMDILMDEQFKCWLLECNNSPGLCDSPEKVPVPAKNGKKIRIDYGAREARKDTCEFVHDFFAMLNLDSYKKHGSAKKFIKIL